MTMSPIDLLKDKAESLLGDLKVMATGAPRPEYTSAWRLDVSSIADSIVAYVDAISALEKTETPYPVESRKPVDLSKMTGTAGHIGGGRYKTPDGTIVFISPQENKLLINGKVVRADCHEFAQMPDAITTDILLCRKL